jgi:hypothetical protein
MVLVHQTPWLQNMSHLLRLSVVVWKNIHPMMPTDIGGRNNSCIGCLVERNERSSSVSIVLATCWTTGVRSLAEASLFFFPDQLWGPPSPLSNGYLSPGVKRGRGVMLTTHPHQVPRSWMSRSYTSSAPLRLHRCVVQDTFFMRHQHRYRFRLYRIVWKRYLLVSVDLSLSFVSQPL